MKLEEIGSHWTPPDGLGYSSLRPVRLSVAGYIMASMTAAFVVGSLVLASTLASQARRQSIQNQRLEREGAEAQATVQRLWLDSGKDREPYVRYRFAAGGREIVGSSKTPRKFYNAMHAGDSLPVRYLPADPHVNHPAQWQREVIPGWVPFVAPLGLLWVAVMFPLMIRREWRLLSEGRPAPGVITKARRRDKYVALWYDFRLLDGSIAKGRSKSSGRKLIAEGTPVTVLYLPDNPKRCGVYPFKLVRLEGARAGASSCLG